MPVIDAAFNRYILFFSILLISNFSFSQNLLTNGNFEQGNGIGFSSNYGFIPAPTGNTSAGQYGIGTNPQPYNTSSFVSMGDHTSGNGNMIIVDGTNNSGNPEPFFWMVNNNGEICGLTTGVTYTFSYWIKSIYNPGIPGSSVAQVRIKWNNIQGGQFITPVSGSEFAPAPGANWQKVTYQFIPTNACVRIEMFDQNGSFAGNDFAIDDFELIPPPEPLSISASLSNVTCPGANDGSIVAYGKGGIIPYTNYALGGSASQTNTTGIFTNLSPGTYTISVTDQNSQTVTLSSIVITQPSDLTAGADKTSVCSGDQVNLSASGGAGYSWSALPADPSLTQTNIPNPVVRPTQTTTYTVTSNLNTTQQLIYNGNFSLGDKGFYTDYKYYSTNSSGLQRAYGIVTNANNWFNGFATCTGNGGSGNMMVFDGSTINNDKVWCQKVPVKAGQTYTFSYFVQSLVATNPANLEVQINGILLTPLPNPQSAPSTTCTWQQRTYTWTSVATTLADICIYNRVTTSAGNDFALDDISFTTTLTCNLSKTVTVNVNNNTVPTFNPVPPICTGVSFSLSTTSTNGISGTWLPAINNTTTTTYTFTPNAGQCATTAQLTVTVITPNANLFAQDTIRACGTSYTLDAGSGFSAYAWSTGATTQTINVSSTGWYKCTVSQSTCTASDSVFVSLVEAEIINNDTTICKGTDVQLKALEFNNVSTICNMNINKTNIPLGNSIPGFTYGGLFNGHYYYIYNTPTTWTLGEQICRQNGGYLVCINDINENAFVSNLTNNNIWIGLFRDPVTCNFRWLDCQNITFTNWRPGEPNSGPCGEPYTQIIRGCSFGLNTWNNLSDVSSNGACYSNMVPIMEIDPVIYSPNSLYPITYLWSTGENTPSINVSPTQTTKYYVTVSNGISRCIDSVTVTVNQASAPIFTQIQPVCRGGNIILPTTSSNGITGSWSPAINNTQTTTYTFTPNSGQCAKDTTMTVVVNQPVASVFTQIDTICRGGTITLPTTSNNGITGTWSPSINNTQTTTYTFTPTVGQCARDTTMTVAVRDPLTPAFTQIDTICNGVTLTLPTISINGIQGAWSPAVNNTVTTTYTFTPDAGQCATTTTMTVTVKQKETPVFNTYGPFCQNAPITLPTLPAASNNGIIGTWSSVSLSTAIAGNIPYTFTPASTECANPATINVIVNPQLPSIFSQVQPVCSGETITLSTTSTNSISGTWLPAINNTTTTTYTFTPATGVCARDTFMTIIVNPVPAVPTAVIAQQTNCTNPTGTITLSGLPSGNWVINPGNISGSDNSYSINNVVPGSYSYSVRDGNGCTSPLSNSVTINAASAPPAVPVATITRQPDCIRGKGSITVNSPTGPGLLYSINGGTPQSSLLFDDLDGGSYRIEVENTLTGCKSQPSVFYTINAAPLPSVSPFVDKDEEYCVGDRAVPVRALGRPQGQLLWYTNATGGIGSTVAPTPSTVRDGTTIYYVTQRLPGFCESPRVPLTVIVHSLPLVNAGGDKEIVRGQRTTLDGTASGTGISVLWTPGFGLSDAKITIPVASPEQTTVYTLTVTSDEGCKSTDNMRVVVKEPRVVKIPNVISPNGDGVHDRWVIGNIEDYPDAEVQIFNRYGTQVYEVRGYNNASGWEGKLNGVDLPVGAYYYIIRLNGKLKPISGVLSVIR